jgi:hypothetical protein
MWPAKTDGAPLAVLRARGVIFQKVWTTRPERSLGSNRVKRLRHHAVGVGDIHELLHDGWEQGEGEGGEEVSGLAIAKASGTFRR